MSEVSFESNEAETMNSYEQRKGSSQPATKIESSQMFRSHRVTHENVGACASVRHKESVELLSH